jgi:hypothetical protein
VKEGPNIKSFAVYCVEYYLLLWRWMSKMLSNRFGQPLAEGTIWSAISQCANGLEKPEEEIKQAITLAYLWISTRRNCMSERVAKGCTLPACR